jgi:HEPN domain-containing protein
MRRDGLSPDDPFEWMNRARSNLIQAQTEVAGVYLEDLCFQAQQAVEKAFKALLLRREVRFPYVHDIAQLVQLLEEAGEGVPGRVRESTRLTEYAVAARYPGVIEPVDPQEYREAVGLAEEAVRWVESRLGPGEA